MLAWALLASMGATLEAAGKLGLIVDPDAAVIRPGRGYEGVSFTNLDDAVAAAGKWLGANGLR